MMLVACSLTCSLLPAACCPWLAVTPRLQPVACSLQPAASGLQPAACSLQPVALNSGSIWPKSGELKPNKTLTVSILDPISPGMNSDEFLNLLQKNIYEEIERII